MQKLSGKNLALVGFTLFSMFFGAGNLIFPPHLGAQAGSSFLPAFLGLAISAVGLPVAGIFIIACFNTCVGLIACVGQYFHGLLPGERTLSVTADGIQRLPTPHPALRATYSPFCRCATSAPHFVTCGDISPRSGENLSPTGGNLSPWGKAFDKTAGSLQRDITPAIAHQRKTAKIPLLSRL